MKRGGLPTNRQRYELALAKQRRDRELRSTPVPARITAALDIRGLYGPEVDRACGVEEPAVDLWESGELVPTAGQVRALSELTGFPVAFFYMPMRVQLGPVWVCGEGGCEVIDNRPPDPVATVLPLTGRGRLL